MADKRQRNATELLFPPATVKEPEEYWRIKKLVKFTIWLIMLVAIHGILILTLHFTLFRVRSPKYRLQSVTVEELKMNDGVGNTNSTNKTPRFNMQLNARVTLKNTNFGTYKFGDGTLTFYYNGTAVGDAAVKKSSVGLWSTKIMRIILNVTLPEEKLIYDNNNHGASGLLVPMSANSALSGKVRFLMVIRKKKSTNMNCNLTVNLVKKAVQELRCS